MLNVQMMPSLLLNFCDSHQAFAGLVSTLAWSTTLAYSGSAGYITSRGRCSFQSNIVWHGQHVGVVSVESMFCWGVLATLLRILLLFSVGAQAGEVWLLGAAVGLNLFFLFSRFIGNQDLADASAGPCSSGFMFLFSPQRREIQHSAPGSTASAFFQVSF